MSYCKVQPQDFDEQLLKSPADSKTRVLNRLKPLPIFAKLFELGLFCSGRSSYTLLLISENKWEPIFNVVAAISGMDLATRLVNTTESGVFFRKPETIPGSIIIYGLFDEGEPMLTEANFVKRAASLLPDHCKLTLLSDKKSPDSLRSIVLMSGVQCGVIDLELDSVSTQGVVLIKG